GDFYAEVTMDGANFRLRGALGADNPDTAKIINSLLSGLLQQAASSMKDQSAQSVLKTLTITPIENEVVLQADIPQQQVADFLREQTKPRPVTKPAKKPVIRRQMRGRGKP